MSDLICTRCGHKFSKEEMIKFKDDMVREEAEENLKENFMRKSGWEAKLKKADSLFLTLALLPVGLFLLLGILLLYLYYDNETFSRYYMFLLVGTAVGEGVSLSGAAIYQEITVRRAERAFQKWRRMCGN